MSIRNELTPIQADLWGDSAYRQEVRSYLQDNHNDIVARGGVSVQCGFGDPCDVMVAGRAFGIVSACYYLDIPVSVVTSQVDWMDIIIGDVACHEFVRKKSVLSMGFRFAVDDTMALGKAFKEELSEALNRLGDLGFNVFPIITYDKSPVPHDVLSIAMSTFKNPHCRKAIIRLPESESQLRNVIGGLGDCFGVELSYTEDYV